MEIDGRIFESHRQSEDLIYLIALAEKKDAEVLREGNEDAAIAVFEEYADGGFDILSEWLRERPEDQAGDQAILAALSKYGFLQQSRDVEAAISDISFG